MPIGNPVTFIREMQEARGHTQTLQDIKSLKALSLEDTVIKVIMNNEFRGASIGKVSKGLPHLVVLAVFPDGAVVVVLNEPDFVCAVGGDLVNFAVVADESFEFAAEGVALDPVDHVATEGGAGGDSAVRVDVVDVVTEVLEDLNEVSVGAATPVCLDLDGELALL